MDGGEDPKGVDGSGNTGWMRDGRGELEIGEYRSRDGRERSGLQEKGKSLHYALGLGRAASFKKEI